MHGSKQNFIHHFHPVRATRQARNSFPKKAIILQAVYKTHLETRAPTGHLCVGRRYSRNDRWRILACLAKHSGLVIRLYRCSPFDSCTGQDSEKNPAVAAAGL
jgi:hypothetical protein